MQILRTEVKDWQGCDLNGAMLHLSFSDGALLHPLLICGKDPR